MYVWGGALSIVFICEPYMENMEAHYIPWHASRRLEVLVLFVSVLLALQLRIWIKKGVQKTKKINLKPLQMLLAFLAAVSVYQPNCFNDYTSFVHTDAYFNSVYRVLRLQPYNEVNCGIYGFYGIIQGPFVKLLGGNFRACVIVLAVLTFFSVLCYFYVLDKLVQNIWLRILGSIGIVSTFLVSWGYIYLQLWPHRFISVGFVLAFIIYRKTSGHEEKKWGMIGIGLLILALVWNLETGLSCVLAYVGSNIVSFFQRYSWKSFEVWKKFLIEILNIPLVLFGAFVFVGIYNLFVGGDFISVQAFLFPFIDNPYVNYLNIELPLLPSAWMLFCALICIMVCIVLWNTSLCQYIGKNDTIVCAAACTIAAAVQCIYYINRSVYGNLHIIRPLAVILIAFLIEYLEEKKSWGNSEFGSGLFCGGIVILSTVLTLIAGTTLCLYAPLELQRDAAREERSMQEVTEMIEMEIPADTLGIGAGIPVIYSYLGWDTGFYALDATDMPVAPVECKKHIYQVLENAEDIFIAENMLQDLKAPQSIWKEDAGLQKLVLDAPEFINDFYDSHKVYWSCEILGVTYSYYRKS